MPIQTRGGAPVMSKSEVNTELEWVNIVSRGVPIPVVNGTRCRMAPMIACTAALSSN